MLDPRPEKGQCTPSDHDLVAEAMIMLVAGMDTTANTLVRGTWHILNNKHVYNRLCEELRRAMPDPNEPASLTALEQLRI